MSSSPSRPYTMMRLVGATPLYCSCPLTSTEILPPLSELTWMLSAAAVPTTTIAVPPAAVSAYMLALSIVRFSSDSNADRWGVAAWQADRVKGLDPDVTNSLFRGLADSLPLHRPPPVGSTGEAR